VYLYVQYDTTTKSDCSPLHQSAARSNLNTLKGNAHYRNIIHIGGLLNSLLGNTIKCTTVFFRSSTGSLTSTNHT